MRLGMVFLCSVVWIFKFVKMAYQYEQNGFYQRDNTKSVHYANFKEYSNHTLTGCGLITDSTHVTRYSHCALECLRNTMCFSFNFAITRDVDGHYLCELLATDKYNHSKGFVPSKELHHYAIESPCEKRPCQNGCKCRALYNKDDYTCDCHIVTESDVNCDAHPVGVTDQSKILDSQMTASSQYNSYHQAAYGRLNGDRGDGWCSLTQTSNEDWLQVDLGDAFYVCGVATQGDRNGDEYVTDFKLAFSCDGTTWDFYRDENGDDMLFHRNGGSSTIDQHTLTAPVSARYIRFHPSGRYDHNCLIVEVYGTKGNE